MPDMAAVEDPEPWTGAKSHWSLAVSQRILPGPTSDPFGTSKGIRNLYEGSGQPILKNRRHFAPTSGEEAELRRLRRGCVRKEHVDRPEGKRYVPEFKAEPPRNESVRMFPRPAPSGTIALEERMTRKAAPRHPVTGEQWAEIEAKEHAFPEDLMGRKVKVEAALHRRNCIGEAAPGDKGFKCSDYCAGFFMNDYDTPKKLSRMATSWFQNPNDPSIDHSGRSISEYVQLFCHTPWRKMSMYAHKDAQVDEVINNSGDAVAGSILMFKGRILNPEGHLSEYGITRNDVVRLVFPEDKSERSISSAEQEQKARLQAEMNDVSSLDNWVPAEEPAPEPVVAPTGKKK